MSQKLPSSVPHGQRPPPPPVPPPRIHVNETPAAVTPEKPSYEELLATAKSLLDLDGVSDMDDRVLAARALIARAGK